MLDIPEGLPQRAAYTVASASFEGYLEGVAVAVDHWDPPDWLAEAMNEWESESRKRDYDPLW